MSLFDKGKSISRRRLRETLRRDIGRIPGGGGRRFSMSERERMDREVFGPKYGSSISKSDYRRAIQGLELSKIRAKDRQEQKKIDEKISYLKELGGKGL